MNSSQYIHEVLNVLSYTANMNPDANMLNSFLRSNNPNANDLIIKIGCAVEGAIASGFNRQEAVREVTRSAVCYFMQYYQPGIVASRQDGPLINQGASDFLAFVNSATRAHASQCNGSFTQSTGYMNQQPREEVPLSGLEAAFKSQSPVGNMHAIKALSEDEIVNKIPMSIRPTQVPNVNQQVPQVNNAVHINQQNATRNNDVVVVNSANDYINKYLYGINSKGRPAPSLVYEVGNNYGLPPLFDSNLYSIQVVYKFEKLYIKLLPKVSEIIMNSENHRNFVLSGFVLNPNLNLKADDAEIYEVDTTLIKDNQELAKIAQASLIQEGKIENRDYNPFLPDDAPFIELIKERIVKLQTESLKNAIMNTVPSEVTNKKAGGVFNIPSTIEVDALQNIPSSLRKIRIDNNLVDTSFIVKVIYKGGDVVSINDTEAKDVCDLLCERDIGLNALSNQMFAVKNNPFVQSLDTQITEAMAVALKAILQVGWVSTSFMEDYGVLINAVADLKNPTNKTGRQITDAIYNTFVRYITDAVPRYEKVDAGYRCRDSYLIASVPLTAADLGFVQPTGADAETSSQLAGYVDENTNPYLYNLCKNLDLKAKHNKIKRVIVTSDNVAITIYAADYDCKTYILVKA